MGIVLDDKHKLIDRSDSKEQAELTKKVNLISKQAMMLMTKERVIPTPENYKTFFENQLEKRSPQEQKMIAELTKGEEIEESEYVATLEKDVQSSYLAIKRMTEQIASSYANLVKVRKWTKEVSLNTTSASITAYKERLDAIIIQLDKELRSIKEHYTNTALLISNFSKNTIYDRKYGIFNKKYLLKVIDATIKNAQTFDYANSLLALRIKPEVLDTIKTKNDKEMLKLTLSKILYKRSRRSDIIAHYEDGIFMILLKHTDENQAKVAADRIASAVNDASFIVNAKSVDMSLEFGLSSICKDDIKEEVITKAIDNLS